MLLVLSWYIHILVESLVSCSHTCIYVSVLLYCGLKLVFTQYKDVPKDHLSWTMGNWIACTRCVSHTGYLADENSKGEAKEKTNTRIIVKD